MKRTAKTLLVATALLAGLAATAVAAPQGVTRYRDTIGSQSANIVTVEMKAGRTGQVVLAGDSVVRDDTTANLIAKQQANGASTLVAAINGGFFNSYYTGAGDSFPDNCPQIYNTIIQNGKVVNAGGVKPVLGFTADGKAMIDKVGFRTMIKLGNGFSVGTWGVNYLYDDPEATMLFTDELTLPVNIPNSSTVVYIKNGTVEKITGGGTTTVPAGTDLLVYNSAVALTEQNRPVPQSGGKRHCLLQCRAPEYGQHQPVEQHGDRRGRRPHPAAGWLGGHRPEPGIHPGQPTAQCIGGPQLCGRHL